MNKSEAKELALPPELLRKLLRYDPETGKLYWKPRDESTSQRPRHFNSKYENKEAGNTNPFGYVQLSVYSYCVRAHRAIYAIMTGEWPEEQVDHINGDKADNRWVNLRAVTAQQNSSNHPGWSKKTASAFIGVHRLNGKWQAQATADGKKYHLGTFESEVEAAKARDDFVSSINPYAKLNFPKETV